jgi:tetratricopeptide (TPR) repeat protein/predicted Ser/Thr protein kinase
MHVTEEIRPGVVLADRFRVHRRIGSGGTATVFLAEDSVLGRNVAIKRLHTEGSKTDVERFRREARLGASLIHPNLVTLFDTLDGPEGQLIVMEYVEGRPLSDLVGETGMDPRRVIEILRPVASALDYAHEHGVVHRDVKPANILIGEDGIVKLVDLGTATAGHVTQITTENQVMGTLAYIAPERLAGDSAGEPAADIYSLAVVAFEALTGRPPRSARAPGELLPRLLHDPPPNAADVRRDLPASAGAMLRQGLDPDPDRRQHTPTALVRDLEAALSEPSGDARIGQAPTEPVAPQSAEGRQFTPPPVSGRGRPWWLWPAAACALALVGVVIWLGLSGGGGDGGPTNAGETQAADRGSPGQSASAANAAGSVSGGTGGGAAASSSGSSSVPVSNENGAQLNDEGYSLIQQGRYEEAVPVLQQAVAAFPENTDDITYAYALYNLGHALRMAGQPEEAIPILERRLEIPDQKETVRRELDAARAAAGE